MFSSRPVDAGGYWSHALIVPGAPAFPILSVGIAAIALLGWWRAAARSRALDRLAADLSLEIDRLHEDLSRMEETASFDRLTGAWNRRRFDEAAASEMGLARRRRAPLSLIMLDLDHFKRINDAYGHPVGDTVLAGAATAFRPVLRTSTPCSTTPRSTSAMRRPSSGKPAIPIFRSITPSMPGSSPPPMVCRRS